MSALSVGALSSFQNCVNVRVHPQKPAIVNRINFVYKISYLINFFSVIQQEKVVILVVPRTKVHFILLFKLFDVAKFPL